MWSVEVSERNSVSTPNPGLESAACRDGAADELLSLAPVWGTLHPSPSSWDTRDSSAPWLLQKAVREKPLRAPRSGRQSGWARPRRYGPAARDG
jgi:hypothetical protein